MLEHLIHTLSSLPAEAITVIIATLPIAELRGAIPWAMTPEPYGGGLPVASAVLFAILGNMIPVIPLLLFFNRVYKWLSPIAFFNRFFEWLFARTRRKGKLIERYEFWGLVLFVGIPLPVTGAWTGTMAAFIFGIKLWKSFLAVILGLLMSATIVTLLTLISLGVINTF